MSVLWYLLIGAVVGIIARILLRQTETGLVHDRDSWRPGGIPGGTSRAMARLVHIPILAWALPPP